MNTKEMIKNLKDWSDTMPNAGELHKNPSGEWVASHAIDNVAHPPHYNTGKIEVIEFIEDQKLGFNLGNAIKYIARAGKKNPEKLKEDLEKARWYLLREIELQKENPRRPNDMK